MVISVFQFPFSVHQKNNTTKKIGEFHHCHYQNFWKFWKREKCRKRAHTPKVQRKNPRMSRVVHLEKQSGLTTDYEDDRCVPSHGELCYETQIVDFQTLYRSLPQATQMGTTLSTPIVNKLYPL